MCREFATRDEDQRLVPPGRLPLPRAQRGQPRERSRRASRCRTTCGLADADAHAARGADASCPSSTPTASSPRATTRTTASSSRGRSCGATRRRRAKLGVEVATFTRSSASRRRGARIDGVRVRRCGPPGAPARATHASARTGSSTPPARGRPRSRACSASSSRTSRTATRSARPSRSSRGSSRSSPTSPTASTSRQSTRGEIVGGIGNEHVPPGLDQESSHAFLGKLRARRSCARAPCSASVKVLRQWAGCYDLTPDANPIVGPVDGVEHFYQA